jgi:hypothetical protein
MQNPLFVRQQISSNLVLYDVGSEDGMLLCEASEGAELGTVVDDTLGELEGTELNWRDGKLVGEVLGLSDEVSEGSVDGWTLSCTSGVSEGVELTSVEGLSLEYGLMRL